MTNSAASESVPGAADLRIEDVRIEDLRQAVENARQQGDPARLHRLLGASGKAALQAGRTLEALTCFTEAVQIAHQVGDPASEGRHYGNQALAQMQIGNFEDGLRSFRKAHSLAQKSGEWQVSCDALVGMASLYLARESEEDALECLQEAQELAEAHQDRARQVRIQLSLGEVAWGVADLDQATRHYQQAQALAKDLDDLTAHSECLDRLMAVYRMQGRYDLAAQTARQALSLFETGDPTEAGTNSQRRLILLARYGEYCFELGYFAAACQAYEAGLALAEQSGNLEMQVRLNGSLGMVLGEQGRYPEAAARAQKALALGEQHGDIRLYGEQLVLYAYACQDLDQNQAAIAACQQALRLFEQLEDHAFIEKTRQCLAELEALQG
jgi:tetratricopeptide (TPR) repeat protein